MLNKSSRSAKVDRVLASAVDLAREALEPIATEAEIGAHLGARTDGERLVTHAFACLKEGYRGWQWVTTVTRVPRSKQVTVCEIDLLPGKDALLAPDWVPWADRLLPSDVKREDVLPYVAEDPRLDLVGIDTKPEDLDEEISDAIGFSRPRVLSEKGRRQAAKRWYASECGPARNLNNNYRSRLPEHTCSDCGFMLKMAGSMGNAFGVCANEWSPDDGRVVSLDHSCGAHSETDVKIDSSPWSSPPHRMDEMELEF